MFYLFTFNFIKIIILIADIMSFYPHHQDFSRQTGKFKPISQKSFSLQRSHHYPQFSRILQPITIKLKNQYHNFILIIQSQSIWITKQQSNISLQINQTHLSQSLCDFQQKLIIIRNLSDRIVCLRFFHELIKGDVTSLHIYIQNQMTFREIQKRIDLIKHMKITEQQKYIEQNKSKTTPQKKQKQTTISIMGIKSNQSTQQISKKNNIVKLNTVQKVNIAGGLRHLKISQRVVANTKQSNLVPSQIDYPVSLKDECQRSCGYLDQFQNILFQDEKQQQKLALNDSFQQFEKKRDSQKQIQIMIQVNKKRQKEKENQVKIQELKQKIKILKQQQSSWIKQNIQLKLDIKKIKRSSDLTENNQIIQLKYKLQSLVKKQNLLISQKNSKMNIFSLSSLRPDSLGCSIKSQDIKNNNILNISKSNTHVAIQLPRISYLNRISNYHGSMRQPRQVNSPSLTLKHIQSSPENHNIYRQYTEVKKI